MLTSPFLFLTEFVLDLMSISRGGSVILDDFVLDLMSINTRG